MIYFNGDYVNFIYKESNCQYIKKNKHTHTQTHTVIYCTNTNMSSKFNIVTINTVYLNQHTIHIKQLFLTIFTEKCIQHTNDLLEIKVVYINYSFHLKGNTQRKKSRLHCHMHLISINELCSKQVLNRIQKLTTQWFQ